MSEIKTCEQYVLSVLKDAQDKVDRQFETITSLKDEIRLLKSDNETVKNKYLELVSFIQNICCYKKFSSDGEVYIDIATIWSSYNPEQFKFLSEILGPVVIDDDTESEVYE